ncbi:MAG TPA: right-handed parallel beta-helix repeat-containing protein [Bacteroidales bacterium]
MGGFSAKYKNRQCLTVKSILRFILTGVAFLFLSQFVTAGNWYVATNGSDTGNGSEQYPFLTIAKAVSVVLPGENIYVKGGSYYLLAPVIIAKSGTTGSVISLFAYPGTKPVLNFSGQSLNGSNYGIKLTGSYWHIKGIDITGAGDNGMKIEAGSHNIIENCAFYRNRDSGLQLDNGASDNTIINCDSYYNADPPDYGDADGFAVKMNVGSGNSFYGCRSWKNCDDGWDGYLRGTDDVSNSLENCWAFENGYLEDGTDPGANANGNGFKMGGSDDKTLKHNFTLKKCLSFKNKAKGFDQNNNKGSMILYNCTGYKNLVADYRITQALAAGKVAVVKNCVDLGKIAEIGSFAEQEKNSWMAPFVVTTGDFISLDETPAYGSRKADGSLPDIDYMHLVSGSNLIDAGVNVGLSYAGSAPDLGCFETVTTGVKDPGFSMEVFSYPNPLNDKGFLQLNLSRGGRCDILLYDSTGRYVKKLAGQIAEAGEQIVSIDLSDMRKGLYICRIYLNDVPVQTAKLIKQ